MASKNFNELTAATLPVLATDEIMVSRDGLNVTRTAINNLPFSSVLDGVYVPDNNVMATPLRQVANNCRFPDAFSGIKQAFAESQHKAGQTITDLYVEFINSRGYQEIVARNTLNIVTAIEYPIRSGNIQYFTYGNGQPIGAAQPGEIIRSDKLKLTTIIPKGANFSLWHYHLSNSSTDWFSAADGVNSGIPICRCSPTFKYTDGSKGKTIIAGSANPVINYLFQNTVAEMVAFPTGGANNGVVTFAAGEFAIMPAAIIATPASDYSGNSTLIIGDERSMGSSSGNNFFSLPQDDTLLSGVAEHAFCRDGRPFINVSNQTNGLGACFGSTGTNSQFFSKRLLFARYCDHVVNALGYEDIAALTSSSVARSMDLTLLNHKMFTGKVFHTMTLPYRVTASTDQFTTLAGQTANASNANLDNLNTYRTTDPDGKYTTVIDINTLLCDFASKKWKVGARARTLQGSMAVGSNVVNITSGTLTPADDMLRVAVVGAGASAATIFGRLQYVSASQGILFGINQVLESTGVALNATTATTGGNIFIDCRAFTNEGLRENNAAITAINAYVATL